MTKVTPILSLGSTNEEIIQQEIVKYDLPETKIAEIKTVCDAVSIAGPDDAEGYKKASAYLAKVRKVRTGIEAKRKELKDLPLKLGKAIDAEAKRLTALVQPIEDRLAAMKAEVDNEHARRHAEMMEARKNALLDNGFAFDGFGYKVGMIVVYAQQLEAMTDEELGMWIERGQAEAQRMQAERLAAAAAAQQVTYTAPVPQQPVVNPIPPASFQNTPAPQPLFDDEGFSTAEEPVNNTPPVAMPFTPPPPTKMVFSGGEIVPANGNHVQHEGTVPNNVIPTNPNGYTAPPMAAATQATRVTPHDIANEGARAGFELFRKRLFQFLDTAPPMNRGQMKAEIQNWKIND